jgi:transposase-like protein
MENMKKSRRKFTSEFKSKVAIEALKERYSLSELAERFELHPNQISQWKQEFLEKSKDVFDKKPSKPKEEQVDLDKLYAKIGKLEVERDYLKKNLKKLELLG